MIRIMNIISDSNIGGAGRVLLNYLRYADRNRFEILVALPRGGMLKSPLEEAGPGSSRWTASPTAPSIGTTSGC